MSPWTRVGAALAGAFLAAAMPAPGIGAGPPLPEPPPAVEGLEAVLALRGDFTGPLTGLPSPSLWAGLARWQEASGHPSAARAEAELVGTPVSLPILAPGAVGPPVRLLVLRLHALGLASGVAGDRYGPALQAVVRRVQADHGARADGWVGPITWRLLLGVPLRIWAPTSLDRLAAALALPAPPLARWNDLRPTAALAPGEEVWLMPPPLVPSRQVLFAPPSPPTATASPMGLLVVGLPQPPGRLPAVFSALHLKATVAVAPGDLRRPGAMAALKALAQAGDELIPALARGEGSATLAATEVALDRVSGHLPILVWAGLRPPSAAARLALASGSAVVVGAAEWPHAPLDPGAMVEVPAGALRSLHDLAAAARAAHVVPTTLAAALGP